MINVFSQLDSTVHPLDSPNSVGHSCLVGFSKILLARIKKIWTVHIWVSGKLLSDSYRVTDTMYWCYITELILFNKFIKFAYECFFILYMNVCGNLYSIIAWPCPPYLHAPSRAKGACIFSTKLVKCLKRTFMPLHSIVNQTPMLMITRIKCQDVLFNEINWQFSPSPIQRP